MQNALRCGFVGVLLSAFYSTNFYSYLNKGDQIRLLNLNCTIDKSLQNLIFEKIAQMKNIKTRSIFVSLKFSSVPELKC